MKTWNFGSIDRWVNKVSVQGLSDAYQSAAIIKGIEDQHFQGKQIDFDPEKGKTVCDYFQTLLNRQLAIVRFGLAQFRISSYFVNRQLATEFTEENNNQTAEEIQILEKLNFIESVVAKYREPAIDDIALLSPNAIPEISDRQSEERKQQTNSETDTLVLPPTIDPLKSNSVNNPSQKNKSRFFLNNFYPFGKQLSLEYEQQVVRELRIRRQQRKIAIRWLIILLIVPIIVQFASKNLIFAPIIDRYTQQHYQNIEVSQEIEEEGLREFILIKQKFEVKQILGLQPELTAEKQKEKLKELVEELAKESLLKTMNGIKNSLADVTALLVFAGLAYWGRDRLYILRTFSNQTFLSLSDPVKVFLFILVTDMFVGFHSAEGWEVILEGVLHHFGLPESKVFVNSFIATVPVIIDSCIKFWIFSYLTRYSPSASAIFERMNA